MQLKPSTHNQAMDLVRFAATRSPFYARLYAGIELSRSSWQDIPVTQAEAFWAAAARAEVSTDRQQSGLVFKSGGTTGQPKFSLFEREEWREFTRVFGEGMARGGALQVGDRVLNCFYAGQLYASFLFIKDSIESSGAAVVQFPMAGHVSANDIIDAMNEFQINVIAGVPTSMVQLACEVERRGLSLPSLERIVFGGESMYEDQTEFIKSVFPGVVCQSIGWASVDGGLLGYSTRTAPNGAHRVFGSHTIIELIDEESGALITEPHRSGVIVLTNLCRKLMPIIRYPAGDSGYWIEDPSTTADPLLQLVGRNQESVRVGPATLYLKDVRSLVHEFKDQLPGGLFQMQRRHFAYKDELTLRVAAEPNTAGNELDLKARLQARLYSERPMVRELEEQKLIHPVQIEICRPQDLVKNPRTGKLRSIIEVNL